MSIFKCKMCGGTIEFEQGSTIGVCDSCGTKQTLPKANDDITANQFNRANNLRLKCEFDKAAGIYEKILEQDDSESEAHWGLVLCKYGIEYVEDPKTHKRIPTCHRTSFESITADPDFLAAVDYSDPAQQRIYEAEAKAINHIQKDILSIVKNEKPFDIFICYKETDDNGKRTYDSVIGNDIYYQLTQEGFKVFYAAITLEDKLGQEYEPYIFAALNSAKIMLVLGTKSEYFNAVWVKNEWSRFMQLMKTDRSKVLIPCFRDMDAYDLPEEFAHLQAQDMGKIGFINDLIRGIKKVLNSNAPAQGGNEKETVIINNGGSTNFEPLLERASLFLIDEDWERADDCCEKVLDQDPKNAKAYLIKLLAEVHARKVEELEECEFDFNNSKNYQKVLKFGDDILISLLKKYSVNPSAIKYNKAINILKTATKVEELQEALYLFQSIPGYKDADKQRFSCSAKFSSLFPVAAANLANAFQTLYSSTSLKECQETIDKIKLIHGYDLLLASDEIKENIYNRAGTIASLSDSYEQNKLALDLLCLIPHYKKSDLIIKKLSNGQNVNFETIKKFETQDSPSYNLEPKMNEQSGSGFKVGCITVAVIVFLLILIGL